MTPDARRWTVLVAWVLVVLGFVAWLVWAGMEVGR